MGECSYNSTILDLENRWRCVFSFTSMALSLLGNNPRYYLYRRLGGTQSLSGRYGEEKNLASAENRTPADKPVARCNPTELS
jgi:hypothetical protein